ncbi:hypothetical protein G9G54_14115 [Paenibacillus sp. EKM212P]|uniref:DUF6037 family protein n=1 Tax=Paenibacillus sp. EKM212P TaxID=1683680 RepID=UPI0013ED9129|nr:DUF6037 family protein [Paenibacillus sp. EKM212P]KAF6578402.1 hypothetical protein G9G54_14115 [Paenibacillus sp. EKM212P]
MKLTNLEPLYFDILKNKKTYDVFDYRHNNIEFSVLFDIQTQPDYTLLFIKKKSDLFLELKISSDFRLNTYLGNKLAILLKMLELSNGSNRFSTSEFFKEFNEKIPKTISQKSVSKKTLTKIYKCEEADNVFIKELRDWDQYPLLNKTVSVENREKTRLLYPDVHESIKDKNISVFYTDKPSKKNLQ